MLGYWVGVRRLIHSSLVLTASRMVLPQDPTRTDQQKKLSRRQRSHDYKCRQQSDEWRRAYYRFRAPAGCVLAAWTPATAWTPAAATWTASQQLRQALQCNEGIVRLPLLLRRV